MIRIIAKWRRIGTSIGDAHRDHSAGHPGGAIPPSRQTGRPTVQLQPGDVFWTGWLGRRQCDRLEKLTVHSSSGSQIKGPDETGTACGGHGQHRVKSQRMLFIDLTSQRTCRNHVELANQGCHEVPDREEDCDCHQCDDGQFPTAVSHQNFPQTKKRRRSRRRPIERTLADLVFRRSVGFFAPIIRDTP